MLFEDTIDIDAPIGTVWALTLDVDRLPEISPTTMTSVQRLDGAELSPGSRARLKQPGQAARTWTVQATEAPHLFVWGTKLGPVRMVATHQLRERDSATTNTLRLELTGAGSGVLGRLLGRRLRQVLATENAGFKRVAEGG